MPAVRGDMVWLWWPLSSITAVIAGTDEGAIIDVVTQRSNAQRQQILKAYKAHYGRVLLLPLPPCSVLLPASCPFPHRDLSLTERNPAPGAVGSQGTPICCDMTPPRKTKLSISLPLWGAQPGASLPLHLSHPQCHTEDSRARMSLESPHQNVLLKPPQGSSHMSPTPMLSSPVSPQCCLGWSIPSERAGTEPPNPLAGPDGRPEIGAVRQPGEADPGAHADTGAVRCQAAEEGGGGNCHAGGIGFSM